MEEQNDESQGQDEDDKFEDVLDIEPAQSAGASAGGSWEKAAQEGHGSSAGALLLTSTVVSATYIGLRCRLFDRLVASR